MTKLYTVEWTTKNSHTYISKLDNGQFQKWKVDKFILESSRVRVKYVSNNELNKSCIIENNFATYINIKYVLHMLLWQSMKDLCYKSYQHSHLKHILLFKYDYINKCCDYYISYIIKHFQMRPKCCINIIKYTMLSHYHI